MKRVMVDSGNAVEVMYHDLYKELHLKLEDLTPYSSPLMSFNGKLVIPKGLIRCPDRPRDSGGELYRGGHLLSIYSHCRQALAPYFGGYRLLFASKGEILVKGPSPRNLWLPIHSKAVCSGRHFALAHAESSASTKKDL